MTRRDGVGRLTSFFGVPVESDGKDASLSSGVEFHNFVFPTRSGRRDLRVHDHASWSRKPGRIRVSSGFTCRPYIACDQ